MPERPVASCQLPVASQSTRASYEDLIVWQKALQLVTYVYKATEKFPAREVYGLTNQIRRAAVSIPSNIAEGQGRRSANDFLHFLGIARGSMAELETQLRIARNLAFLSEASILQLLESTAEVGRLLNGLMSSLGHHRRAS